MKVGFSLPLYYLADKTDKEGSEKGKYWELIFGKSDNALKTLKESGVTSIEIDRPWVPEHIIKAVEKVKKHELDFTFHLWSLKAFDQENYYINKLLEVFSNLNIDNETVGTIHGLYHSSVKSDEDPLKETVSGLHRLKAKLEPLPLEPVIELLRIKDKKRVGVTFSELDQILKNLDDDTGICWDMGHGWFNHLFHNKMLIPEEKILRKIKHTHIHDMGPGNKTHWPLKYGENPIRKKVKALKENGYQGVYNLELSPNRWKNLNINESKEAIINSIKELKLIVQGG